MSPPPPWQTPAIQRLSRIIAASHRRWTGRDLVPQAPDVDLARVLYELPAVVLAHAPGPDPLFIYANRTAQRLWELDWPGFLALPSRRSAEPESGPERAAMLAQAQRDGHFAGYRGIRIATTGRRFRIEDALLWNLLDEAGAPTGQAATFSAWTMLGNPSEG
jgi:hypothetical protein